MKLHWLLFACCIGMCFVLIAAFTIEERPIVETTDPDTGVVTVSHQGHGIAHEEFDTMLQGGPGEARHKNILWLGWIFGTLIAILFVATLAFGARRNDIVGPIKVPLLIGGIIYTLIWTAMVWSYSTYMTGDNTARLLALPIPTAWMVYGYWLFPTFFIVLFVRKFSDYIWDEDSEAKFNEILEAKKQRDEETA